MKKVMKQVGVLAAATAMAAASVVSVGAATATGSFNATITITDECLFTSATDLAFGSHTFLTSNIDTTSDVVVTCTASTPYTVDLAGSGSMTSGGNSITYAMYSDSARTTVWSAVGGTGTGSAQTLTVYGRVPVQTSQPAGSYTDAVTVTITY